MAVYVEDKSFRLHMRKRVFLSLQRFLFVLSLISVFYLLGYLFSPRGETIPLARVNYSLREDNVFSSRGEYVLLSSDGENDWWFLADWL